MNDNKSVHQIFDLMNASESACSGKNLGNLSFEVNLFNEFKIKLSYENIVENSETA